MDPPSNDEDPQRTFAVTGVAGENAVTYMSFALDRLLSDIVLFSYFTKYLRSYYAENDPPKKKKTMPNRKRKYSRRLRISNCTPVTSSTAQETDAAPPIAETDGPPGAETNVSSSSEPPNPYKKMRVAECRLNLVDRDDEIVQLKLALEASKEESLAKDAIIAKRKESTQQMSKDLQVRRRECNLMLAEQREANTRVAEDAEEKVVASRRDRDAVVAEAKDAAAAQVLLSISDRNSKVTEALLDKKRVLQAERVYCKERRKEATDKVKSQLFAERVMQGDIVSKMEEHHEDLVVRYEIEATKSKRTIHAQKNELSVADVKAKSASREKRNEYSAKLQEKNASINRLEKEYGGSIDLLVTTCKQLVSGLAAAADDASQSNMTACGAKAVASQRLDKLRECQAEVTKLQDGLILESKERYRLALDNEVLEMQMQELKDDYERRIRELTPRVLAKDWTKKGAWPNWVIQLIVELLSHRTPPSCVSANILSVVSLICPSLVKIGKHLFANIVSHLSHQPK